jgi:hypothetical protein
MTNGARGRIRRRRATGPRVRALLAGGLAAAVGIGGTLAAWNTRVLGEASVTGSDPLPFAIALQDASGEWVSGPGPVALLSAATYSARDLAMPIPMRATPWAASGFRIAGSGSGQTLSLRTVASVSADAAETRYMSAFLTDHPTAACADIPPSARRFVVGSEGVLAPVGRPVESVTTLAAPVELRLCTMFANMTDQWFGADMRDVFRIEFTAGPADA